MLMPLNEHEEIKKLLEENLAIGKENKKTLASIRRIGIIELLLRLLWYAILIGAPFALYFYILGPYLEALGASYSQFNQGVQELPGVKAFGTIFEKW